MRLGEAFRVALDALRANRLRSLLTMIGVIIGVGAVVVLVALGGGAKQEVEHEVESLGSNIILVVPGKFSYGAAPTLSHLQLSDATRLERVVGDPRSVAVTITSGETIRAGTATTFATVEGTNQNVPYVFDRPLSDGRYITATDVDTRQQVIVLGADVATALFPDGDAVGRHVIVANVGFRVVGVFAARGSAFGISQDTQADIPVTTAEALFGTSTIQGFAVKAPSAAAIGPLQDRLVAALTAQYPGQEFSALTQSQILGTIGRILDLLTLVLAAIAGISLLVGGVGVSNIMLVGVRERTAEIGLRKALGARQRDIVVQFLIEAVLLTCIGGAIGIALGIGASLAVAAFSPLPAAIAWWSVLLAFAVSAAVGICFGVFPARRAGRLDPVTALRSE